MSSTSSLRRRLAIVARAPALSAAQLTQLAAAGDGLESLERPDRATLRQLGLSTQTIAWLEAPDEPTIADDLRWLDRSGATLVPVFVPEYPAMLRESPDAPAVLYVRGDVRVLSEPQLAMVGSRNPT